LPELRDLKEVDAVLNRNVVPWTERWEKEGFERGIAKGRQEGRQEQTRAMVRRLLSRRFGPLSEGIEARLEAADLGRLEAYADRLLDAPTLDAVFLEE
jgi:hypothetical protein